MAFQSVLHTAEAVTRFSLNGVILTNTHYFEHPGGYDSDDIINLAGDVDEWVGAEWIPLMLTSTNYLSTVVRGLELENDDTAEADASAQAGTNSKVPLPNNVSFALKRSSSLTGRSARGRIYVTGIGQGDLAADENFLATAVAEAFRDALETIPSYVSGNGWTPVIVSRYSGGVKRVLGVTFPLVAWSFTDTRIDTRRDRLPATT